jgi:predicted  nucleic acid-binding Zn-ribbon protein
VKTHEDRILERMLEADDLTAAVKRAESDLAAEQQSVEADRKAYATGLAGVREGLERITAERADLVRELSAPVLATFELVARRRNGVAVAEAREGVCTICHVRMRPQVFNVVRRNDEIVQCDSCQRILYFVPVAAPAPTT